MTEPLCAAPDAGSRLPFAPSAIGTLLTVVCVMLFVHLGQWQQDKADRKRAAQQVLERQHRLGPVPLPTALLSDPDAFRYAPVTVRGTFEPERQFLVDNRVLADVAGYHVVTPLRLADSEMRVLVNRGWIPAPALRSAVPQVETPTGEVVLQGTAVLPGQRFYTLGPPPDDRSWQPVWQHLDLERFRRLAPWAVQPVVVELQAGSPAGFVRDWSRPDDRWERHQSYALQWFGFAASSVAIWAFVSWKRACT